MTGKTRVNILLNFPVTKSGNKLTLDDGGTDFINELFSAPTGLQFILCAKSKHGVIAPGQKTLIPEVNFCSLSVFTADNPVTYLPKTLYAVIKLLILTFSKTYFFVYLPSNINLTALLIMVLFRRKFGLYVRGEITKSRIFGAIREFGWLHSLYLSVIRRADFIFAEGEHLFNSIKVINKNAEKSIPMIRLKPGDISEQIPDFKGNRLLYVGRIHPDKGIDILIEIAAGLKNRGLKFELILVGDGEAVYLSDLKNKIKSAGCEREAVFTGSIHDFETLKKIYQSSDYFIFPSFSEGFPRVFYEAMAFGLPIIAADIEPYEGSMKSGYNCILIRSKSPEIWINEILMLLNNNKLSEEISRGGLQFINGFFRDLRFKSFSEQVTYILNTKPSQSG